MRDSNIVNTMMMSIISMGLTTITWLVFGFTWSFDEWGAGKGFTYVGFRNLDAVWSGTTMPGMTFAVFQMTLGLNLQSRFSRSMVWRHVLCRSDNVLRYDSMKFFRSKTLYKRKDLRHHSGCYHLRGRGRAHPLLGLRYLHRGLGPCSVRTPLPLDLGRRLDCRDGRQGLRVCRIG